MGSRNGWEVVLNGKWEWMGSGNGWEVGMGSDTRSGNGKWEWEVRIRSKNRKWE